MRTSSTVALEGASLEGAALADALCKHCRTPLARGTASEFCCKGCAGVYTLLERSGLDRYYALRGERTLLPVGDNLRTHEDPWLDAEGERIASQPGMHRVTLDVQGIQCGACVWLIETLFRREAHGVRAQVNPALGRLSLLVDAQFPLRSFVHGIESFGYRLGPPKKTTSSEGDSLRLRTGVCIALAANTMLVSAATYFGLSEGPLYQLVQQAAFAMTTLSALIGGEYFVRRALLGLRRGVLHLDLPIALGMGLAYAGSALSVFVGKGSGSYLDTVSVFIALMLVGRLLQERLVEKNRQTLLSSDGASGLLARRVHEGRTQLVPCAELEQGHTVLVCPGEIVPVRARLEDATATCTLDWINGESEPRRFTRGEALVAGAINAGTSALRATALAPFERSDLDALLREEQGHGERLRGDFWDRLARVYVLLVLLATAVGAALTYLRGGSAIEVLDVATAVLVVTCPCAFGIATPLAYELAVAGLRRAGLFVRDGSFFDRGARVRKIVFDKTGTLTTGSLELADAAALDQLDGTQRQVLYDLTAQSNHPKSSAIARALAARDADLKLSGLHSHEQPGLGVECVRDGHVYRIGEPRWVAADAQQTVGPLFGVDGRPLAQLACVEVTRADATREAAELTREGYALYIASGDEQKRADEMAERLAIAPSHTHGNLTPGEKRALVERIDARDTLMLGDGINDGPALTRALCSGTPAVDRPFVPARTDFYFLTAGLAPVRLALRVSRRVRKVVRNALIFATAYNVFAIGLSYAGLMQPWLAAVLMPASSLLVLAYAMTSLSPRSSTWKS